MKTKLDYKGSSRISHCLKRQKSPLSLGYWSGGVN